MFSLSFLSFLISSSIILIFCIYIRSVFVNLPTQYLANWTKYKLIFRQATNLIKKICMHCVFTTNVRGNYPGWYSARGSNHDFDWSSEFIKSTLFLHSRSPPLGCDAIHVWGILSSYYEICLSWRFWRACHCHSIAGGSESSRLSSCSWPHP